MISLSLPHAELCNTLKHSGAGDSGTATPNSSEHSD
jgi:hypothetical protein